MNDSSSAFEAEATRLAEECGRHTVMAICSCRFDAGPPAYEWARRAGHYANIALDAADGRRFFEAMSQKSHSHDGS